MSENADMTGFEYGVVETPLADHYGHKAMQQVVNNRYRPRPDSLKFRHHFSPWGYPQHGAGDHG
jgi:hypothetical protein